MNIANDPLNRQAIILEEAETEIRKAVKDDYFARKSKTAIDKKVFGIIVAALKRIRIPSLRELAQSSLLKFYNRQYSELRQSFDGKLAVLTAVLLLSGRTTDGRELKPTAAQRSAAVRTIAVSSERERFTAEFGDGSRILGNAANKYAEEYIRREVQPALERLTKMYPEDPRDSADRRVSLRNLAEMQVRWQNHVDETDRLKARGVKLVIISSHADCSKRCAKAQGRVYSLDGTSGVTDDGRKYEPIETVTDVYVTTKSGTVYKNGLFGFNCRHYMIPYEKGLRVPQPNAETERREYAITKRQRELEREVRQWRTAAVEQKGISPYEYSRARKKAIEANKRYIEFSKANNRAYYPSRVRLI